MSLTPIQLSELQTIVLDLGDNLPDSFDALWDSAIRIQKAGLGPVTGPGGQPAFDATVADIVLTSDQIATVQGKQGGPGNSVKQATFSVVPVEDNLPAGALGDVIYVSALPNIYSGTSVISLTPAGPNSVQLDEVGTTVVRTVPAASGGLEVNNLATGGGFERVLTTADGGASGDVVGPAGATDEAIARYDLATGKLIQNSNVTIDDAGNIDGFDGMSIQGVAGELNLGAADEVKLYSSGLALPRIQTTSQGASITGTGGSPGLGQPISPRITFGTDGGVGFPAGSVGWGIGGPDTVLHIQNLVQGGSIRLEGEDTGGTLHSLIEAFPDSFVNLYDPTNDQIVANTQPDAQGGFEVRNTRTGFGGERVHTISDRNAWAETWLFSIATNTTVSPVLQQFKMNNVNPALVTEIALNDSPVSFQDWGTIWGAQLAVGDRLTLVQTQDNSKYVTLTVSGALIDGGGFWRIPVTVVSSGTIFDTGADVHFMFAAAALLAAPGAVANGIFTNPAPVDQVDTNVALNVGAVNPGAATHLEFSPNEIQCKTDNINTSDMTINPFGGTVQIGQTQAGTVATGDAVAIYLNDANGLPVAQGPGVTASFQGTRTEICSIDAGNPLGAPPDSIRNQLVFMDFDQGNDYAWLGFDGTGSALELVHLARGSDFLLQTTKLAGGLVTQIKADPDLALELLATTEVTLSRAGGAEQAAATVSAATGGLFVNNLATGAGSERVLTTSDLSSGGAQISGTPVNNQIAIWVNGTDIEGDANYTWDGSEQRMVGLVRMQERAASLADVATYSQLWVRNTSDGELILTDDQGLDQNLSSSLYFNGAVKASGQLIGLDITGNLYVNISGQSIYVGEKASANIDQTGDGQVWVRTDTFSNTLMFTNDNGNDFEVAGIPLGGDVLDGTLLLATTTFAGVVNIGPKPDSFYMLQYAGMVSAPAADDIKIQLTVDTNSLFIGTFTDSTGQVTALVSAIGTVVTNTVIIPTTGTAIPNGETFTIQGHLHTGATAPGTLSLRAAKNADTGADGSIYFAAVAVTPMYDA